MKEINLRKILEDTTDSYKDEDGNRCWYEWQILEAMKEVCEQAIDLCAENALMGNTENGIYNIFEVSKQSILNVKNLIK